MFRDRLRWSPLSVFADTPSPSNWLPVGRGRAMALAIGREFHSRNLWARLLETKSLARWGATLDSYKTSVRYGHAEPFTFPRLPWARPLPPALRTVLWP